MSLKRLASVAIVLASLTTAACGGGGGGGTVVPTSPGVTSTTPPASAQGTGISTSGVAVAATGASGITSSLTVAGSGTVNASESSTAPVGLASLAAAARKPESTRSTQATGNTPLVYLSITAATATTITGLPAASITFSTAPPAPVYLAYYSGSSWVTLTGPATISGTTVTFAASTFTPAISLLASQSLFLAVYTGGVLNATPAPSPTATASASASPSASPSPVTSGTPFPIGTANPAVSVQNSAAFFSTVIPTGSVTVVSVWDISTDLTNALVAAANAGKDVTVITPYSQRSSNATALASIVAAGGKAVYENGSGTNGAGYTYVPSAPMDFHAKFAIIDGVAYMDGHNWFTTDVIIKDTDATDIAAIHSDLTSFPAQPPNGNPAAIFTTDKQVSLKAESDFIQGVVLPAVNSGAADEFDFILESYNPNPPSGNTPGIPYSTQYNDNVYVGMCQIASAARKPTIKTVFEQESGYSSAAITSIQNLILWNPANASSIRSNNNGHDKISMIRKSGVPLAAWFGSSNSTTTDLYDWGMVTYDPALLTALASYFDNVEYANATAVTPGSGSPTACGSVHT